MSGSATPAPIQIRPQVVIDQYLCRNTHLIRCACGKTLIVTFERVINIRNCPLCHRPRLKAKAEVDIVTHLAVCASGDWGRVDRMVTGNYVTASQATRKWYTKVITKVSSGSYQIGAVGVFFGCDSDF